MNDNRGPLPLVRDGKRDFASASGPELLKSKVLQVLMTEPGELPWSTEFGAGLARLRHQRNSAVLQELARVYVRDALRKWLPEAHIVALTVRAENEHLRINLRVRHGEVRASMETQI